MEKFETRLSYLIDKHLVMSVREFEKKIKVAPGTIARALTGTKIGIDKIQAISDNFPEINMDWLLSGEGQITESVLAKEDEPVYNKSLNDKMIEQIIKINDGLMENITNMTKGHIEMTEATKSLAKSNELLIDKLK